MNAMRLAVVATAVSLFAIASPMQAAELEPAPSIVKQASEVPPDVEITLVPDWKVGNSYRIEHLKQREEIRRGQRLPRRISSSLTKIEILESAGNSYVLAATLDEAEMSNFGAPDQGGAESTALFTELFKGQTIEFVTNGDGVPVGLRNKAEVVGLMRKAMDNILPLRIPDPQQQQKARVMMIQMMTPDVIEATFIKDAVIFYGLLGGIYEGGPAQTYDLPMLFPFSQEMVDAKLHVLLRRIDDDGGLVHISTQSVPDSAHLKSAFADRFKGVVQAQGGSLPRGFQFPEFTMQDTTRYVVDRNRVLPTEVTFERYVRMGNDMLRVDRDVFRLKPAD